MQVAPVGAMEVALSGLTAIASQQQVAAAAVAQPSGLAADGTREKHAAAKAKQADRGEQATSAGHQQAAAQTSHAEQGPSAETEAAQPVSKRQLFDYLAELEKTGGGSFNDPSALFGSALRSVEATMQQVQSALGGAGVSTSLAKEPASQTAEPAHAGSDAQKEAGTDQADTREADMARLLDRSISVMWAAANLEVVISSVTAASSSTGTLIKQQ